VFKLAVWKDIAYHISQFKHDNTKQFHHFHSVFVGLPFCKSLKLTSRLSHKAIDYLNMSPAIIGFDLVSEYVNHVVDAAALFVEILVLEDPMPGFHKIVCVDALVRSLEASKPAVSVSAQLQAKQDQESSPCNSETPSRRAWEPIAASSSLQTAG
jgi:hypothetical protein